MTDQSQSDQVRTERLREQNADQPRDHDHDTEEVAGRGGALHRLATDDGSDANDAA
jgi:hypothetical protein